MGLTKKAGISVYSDHEIEDFEELDRKNVTGIDLGLNCSQAVASLIRPITPRFVIKPKQLFPKLNLYQIPSRPLQ